MENASKALIIAGAILISILIISLGVIIYQQAAGVINNNSMDELEVTQFNEKYNSYFGEHVKGATAKSLVNAVKANNNSQDDGSKKIQIVLGQKGAQQSDTIKTGDQDTTTTFNYPTLKTGATYNIKATQYTTAGLISEITIIEN